MVRIIPLIWFIYVIHQIRSQTLLVLPFKMYSDIVTVKKLTMNADGVITIRDTGDLPIFEDPGVGKAVTITMTYDYDSTPTTIWCHSCIRELLFAVDAVQHDCRDFFNVAYSSLTLSVTYTSDGTWRDIVTAMTYDFRCDYVINHIPRNVIGYISGTTLAPSIRTSAPTFPPSAEPSASPSESPTVPTESPSKTPSVEPSVSPSKPPTSVPTETPSKTPSVEPSVSPSKQPTSDPTEAPSKAPSNYPSASPSEMPSKTPSVEPTTEPTQGITVHLIAIQRTEATDRSLPNVSPPDTTFTVNNTKESLSTTVILYIAIFSFVFCGVCLLGMIYYLFHVLCSNTKRKAKDDIEFMAKDQAIPNHRAAVVIYDDVELQQENTNDANAKEVSVYKEADVKPAVTAGATIINAQRVMVGSAQMTAGSSDTDIVKKRHHRNVEAVQYWMENVVQLPVYYGTFISNGYDSLAIIKEINDIMELEEIGIVSTQHQSSIMKEIDELKQENVRNLNCMLSKEGHNELMMTQEGDWKEYVPNAKPFGDVNDKNASSINTDDDYKEADVNAAVTAGATIINAQCVMLGSAQMTRGNKTSGFIVSDTSPAPLPSNDAGGNRKRPPPPPPAPNYFMQTRKQSI